jgi:hypothetical protein
MITYHSHFETPEENTKIWRYMTLPKFLDLLINSSLFFPSVVNMEDPWEGALPDLNLSQMEHMINALPNVVQKSMKERLNYSYKKIKPSILVSCWYEADDESAAMWDLYSSKELGVSIWSTIGMVRSSFKNAKENIMIGRIKYIDYKSQTFSGENLLLPFLRKRLSYSHEREIRLIHWDVEKFDKVSSSSEEIDSFGKAIKCDISKLIGGIFVSPRAPSWSTELIISIISKINDSVKCGVVQSSLLMVPK